MTDDTELLALLQEAHDKLDEDQSILLEHDWGCRWCKTEGYDGSGQKHTPDCILVRLRLALQRGRKVNKDKVLPLTMKVPEGLSIPTLWAKLVVSQRDADWEVLERDFVSKERVKPLVKAGLEILSWYRQGADWKELSGIEHLEQALAELSVEVKL